MSMNEHAVASDEFVAGNAPFPNMVWIPGGTFLMGSDKPYREEAPAHGVTVNAFWMDEHTVTNEEFRRFVDTTKYVTFAERAPNPEDYPDAKPELLVPASVVFQRPRHPWIFSIVIDGGRMFRAQTGSIRKDRRVH